MGNTLSAQSQTFCNQLAECLFNMPPPAVPLVSAAASSAARAAADFVRSLPIDRRRDRLSQLVAMHHASSALSSLTRVVCISDVHTDHAPNNWSWLSSLPPQPETLCIVAGDVCDSLDGLAQTLTLLQGKFGAVSYTPGNHDLWILSPAAKENFPPPPPPAGKRFPLGGYQSPALGQLSSDDDSGTDGGYTSLDKLLAILELCDRVGVCHGPAVLRDVVVVPLLSWYIRGDGGTAANGLYRFKKGEDPEMTMEAWSDNFMCVWPKPGDAVGRAWGYDHGEISDHLGYLNLPRLALTPALAEDRAVVTFSHFLGRQELIFESDEERMRRQVATGQPASNAPGKRIHDPNVWFNFSMVAGCALIDTQCRAVGSQVHVHGHQHRQRDRRIDGVRYVSHCLAYHNERAGGLCYAGSRPKQVWPS